MWRRMVTQLKLRLMKALKYLQTKIQLPMKPTMLPWKNTNFGDDIYAYAYKEFSLENSTLVSESFVLVFRKFPDNSRVHTEKINGKVLAYMRMVITFTLELRKLKEKQKCSLY